MKDSECGSDCELIIDPVLLAQIQAHCGKIAAELEATGELQRLPIAPGRPQAAFGELPVPPPISEAEHFAAAVSEMPLKMRAFFEREESPYIPPHRRESDQARASANSERVGVAGAASAFRARGLARHC
jgi:hypothetical protein